MPITNPGAMLGSGIVGFASNADSDSIMVYNDQTNYGDWEFIFDPADQVIYFAFIRHISGDSGDVL